MSKEKSSLIAGFSKFLIVISAVVLSLKLWSKGLMTPELTVFFLIVVVVAAVIDSFWSKLILAITSLVVFLIMFTDYDLMQFKYAFASVGALIGVLFGMYVMLGGMRNRK